MRSVVAILMMKFIHILSYGLIGTAYAQSDNSLKQNIAPMTYGLHEISQLNPVQYSYKSDTTNSLTAGFLVSNVYSVMPAAIHGIYSADTSITLYGYDASMIFGTMINAFQQFYHNYLTDSIALSSSISAKASTSSLKAVAFSGSYNDLSNQPTIPIALTIPILHDSVSRSLNTTYTITSTGSFPIFVCYSIQINVTLALSALTGSVYLQYSINGGTTWKSLPKVAFTPALAGLGLTTNQIVQINGFVPVGAIEKITTTTVSGITYIYQTGQETY